MKKALMLGWEYPPHISGGLGTACEGLTKALAGQGVQITFIVPRLYGLEDAPHMLLVDPSRMLQNVAGTARGSVQTIRVPAFLKPYWTEEQFVEYAQTAVEVQRRLQLIDEELDRYGRAPRAQYGKDIFEEVSKFTSAVLAAVANMDLDFDLIHAHDWMTFPAGVALAQMTGKPLIVHVHSLESDRSGRWVNQKINEIERLGVQQADLVIAVSWYTRSIIAREHGVLPDKIRVVHNGIYPAVVGKHYRKSGQGGSRIVLFLGRITYQKGPGIFVAAAAKVVPYLPEVLFVMAGTGDLLPKLQREVQQQGLSRNFMFPGFLKGRQVEEMFSLADLYVMPSVSEPFGLSALEAINFDTPALISKQSGVAEVLQNTLKFDFWDVDRLADLIVCGLSHEELRSEMVKNAKLELGRLRWDAAAVKTIAIYQNLAG